MRRLIAFLLLISCGSSVEPVLPRVDSEHLTQAIERVEPLLEWQCDMPTSSPGRCDGDGVSMTGRWLLDTSGERESAAQAVAASVGTDGRPWRNPKRVDNDDDNSFSRDQLLGLLEATVATGNREPLVRVLAYVERTGKLCPGDDRCNMTHGVWVLVRDVLDEHVTKTDREIEEATMRIEAATVPPNYQAYLVARKLMLHVRTGTLTTGHAKVAALLHKRFPKSLFIKTVYLMTSKGTPAQFSDVAFHLAACLDTVEPSGTDWHGNAVDRECATKPAGHELVALGKLLLGLRFSDDVISFGH